MSLLTDVVSLQVAARCHMSLGVARRGSALLESLTPARGGDTCPTRGTLGQGNDAIVL